MPLTDLTRQEIHDYLLKEIRRFIREKSVGVKRDTPFHSRLLPQISNFQFPAHSFYTRSGSWWQVIAGLIGRQFNAEASNGYLVSGHINSLAAQHIVEILKQMERKKERRKPNRAYDIEEVCTNQDMGGDPISLIADLYVRTFDGVELYFEMKTPEPNKAHSREMKQMILRIAAMRKGHRAEAYAATAYNPFGPGVEYTWNYAMQFLEIGKDMLIGNAFWSKIGDEHTYNELLEITEAVGRQIDADLAAGATPA